MNINHVAYQKKVKGLSGDELRFIIQDCKEAIAAYPENPKCGYYTDEIHYCTMELNRIATQEMNRRSRDEQWEGTFVILRNHAGK